MEHLPTLSSANTTYLSTISPVGTQLEAALREKIDNKTKPLGALGVLEQLALRLGLIQNTLNPSLSNPTVLLFAADHGIAAERVSPYPQEVTQQMVYNFLAGGAAINVFARQHGLEVFVVDAGVNHDFAPHPQLIDAKIAHGTANMVQQPAMTVAQRDKAIEKGRQIADDVIEAGSNLLIFGEMGISNTSSSALILSFLCRLPIEACVGVGTGHEDNHLAHKLNILEQVQQVHENFCPENADCSSKSCPLETLTTVGGFEIAQMMGGMLHAACRGVAFMVDGFISTAAFLLAYHLEPDVKDYAFFSHVSREQGHRWMLEHIGATPLLSLNMALGEGSGAAVAYPLLQSAVSFLNEMASFENAGVSMSSKH